MQYAIFDESSWQYLCKDGSWLYVDIGEDLVEDDFEKFDLFNSSVIALSKISVLRKEFLAEDPTDNFYFTLHAIDPVVTYTVNEAKQELKDEIVKANKR